MAPRSSPPRVARPRPRRGLETRGRGQRTRRGRLLPAALLGAWLGILGLSPAGAAEPDEEGEPEAVTPGNDAGAYYTQFELMLAHLHLGEELYRLGEDDDARAHLAAPASDRLPRVGAAMQEHGLERIVDRIEELAEAARESRSWLDVQDLYEATRMSIQRAQTEVDPETRESAGFQARVVLAIARRALDEYVEAVADGAVVDEDAYRTAYGFARHGYRILEEKEGPLGLPDRDVYEDLLARYERLMDAWPSARPSGEDAVAVAEVRQRVDDVAAIVERY